MTSSTIPKLPGSNSFGSAEHILIRRGRFDSGDHVIRRLNLALERGYVPNRGRYGSGCSARELRHDPESARVPIALAEGGLDVPGGGGKEGGYPAWSYQRRVKASADRL